MNNSQWHSEQNKRQRNGSTSFMKFKTNNFKYPTFWNKIQIFPIFCKNLWSTKLYTLIYNKHKKEVGWKIILKKFLENIVYLDSSDFCEPLFVVPKSKCIQPWNKDKLVSKSNVRDVIKQTWHSFSGTSNCFINWSWR